MFMIKLIYLTLFHSFLWKCLSTYWYKPNNLPEFHIMHTFLSWKNEGAIQFNFVKYLSCQVWRIPESFSYKKIYITCVPVRQINPMVHYMQTHALKNNISGWEQILGFS